MLTVWAVWFKRATCARLVLNLGLCDHVTPTLKQLHWLPVGHRINYKLCTLMYQIHTGHAPQYLAHSVQSIAESSRRPGLRSTNTADYQTSHLN